MKKLILITMLFSVALFAANTIRVEEQITKIRFPEVAKSDAAQKQMQEDYPLPNIVDSKASTFAERATSMKEQAQAIRYFSNFYLYKNYGDLTPDLCEKFIGKSVENSICKYKKARAQKSSTLMIKSLESLKQLEVLKSNEKAFCIRQILTLQNASESNQIISDVAQELNLFLLNAPENQAAKRICDDAYSIVTIQI